MVAKRTKEEINMIEIKGYQRIEQYEGYSMEDLIATERENARLNVYFELLREIVNQNNYNMDDQIRTLFGWKKTEEE